MTQVTTFLMKNKMKNCMNKNKTRITFLKNTYCLYVSDWFNFFYYGFYNK